MLSVSIATTIIVILYLIWLRYSLNFIDSIKGFQGFLHSSPYELSGILLMIFIPLILVILTLIFIYLMYLFIKNKSFQERIVLTNNKIHAALDVMSRRMIESIKLSHSSEFFKVYPMIIEYLSDTLTDIIIKSGMASELIISSEMEKYGNNRIIATCRIILSLKEQNSDFDENLRRAIKKNDSLFASVEYFKKSYDKLLESTMNYDRDKFLYSALETGVIGKVYLILSRLLDSVKQ